MRLVFVLVLLYCAYTLGMNSVAEDCNKYGTFYFNSVNYKCTK